MTHKSVQCRSDIVKTTITKTKTAAVKTKSNTQTKIGQVRMKSATGTGQYRSLAWNWIELNWIDFRGLKQLWTWWTWSSVPEQAGLSVLTTLLSSVSIHTKSNYRIALPGRVVTEATVFYWTHIHSAVRLELTSRDWKKKKTEVAVRGGL